MKQYRVATISYKMGGLASSSNTKNKTLWFICSKKKIKMQCFPQNSIYHLSIVYAKLRTHKYPFFLKNCKFCGI